MSYKKLPVPAVLLLLLTSSNVYAAEKLKEITVAGEAESEAVAELPLGTAISGETLKTIPGSSGDPLRGIQALPGITLASDESADPAIRGSRPSENYYQVDFMPAQYLFHLGGAVSVFNSELVDKFTLYPSAYGPEFSGVTGGVIDVALRDPKRDRFHATLDINFLHAGVLVEGPITENQSFYLAGRVSYLDLLLKGQLDDEDGLEYVQYPEYSDYQGKYRLDLHGLGVVNLQFSGATDLAEINVKAGADGVDNEPVLLGRHYNDTSYHSQGLEWALPFGEGHELKSTIAHYNNSFESESGNAGNSKVTTETLLFKSHLRYQLNDVHTIKTGGEFSTSSIDYSVSYNEPGGTEFEPSGSITSAERLSTKTSIDQNNLHLFVQDNWFLSDRLSLYSGMVFHGEDYLEKCFLEPRLALEYDIGNGFLFNAGAGVYHQQPAYSDVDKVFGNPDLEYVESMQAVMGLQKIFGGGWSIKSDIYYKNMDNLVTGDVTGAKRYTNDGEGYTYGLETMIRKDLTDKLSGWLSFTLSEAKRKHSITGREFPFDYDQPYNVSLVTQYKWSEKMTFGMKYWLHSGSPYTPVRGSVEDPRVPGHYEALYGAVNSNRLPMYNRLDLRVDRKLMTKGRFKLTGYIDLLNVLNTKNVSSYDYNKDYSSRAELYQLPRIVSFGLKAEF